MSNEVKTKKFALSEEEKKDMQQCMRISDDLYMQQMGIKRQMDYLMVGVQVRCGVAEDKAPAGYTRKMRLDPTTYQLIIEDFPIVPEIVTK